MRIMVTGSAGFIGKHVARALTDAGHGVFFHNRTHTSFCDCDLIVHCAAAAGPWHTQENIWRDNIDLTRKVIEFAKPTYTPIIFTSSIMVHGDNANRVVNEQTPVYSGASYYAQSKHMCEYMLHMSGVSYVSLRLPAVIGPDANLRNWLPNTARLLLQGKPTTIYGPKFLFNNVVHVNDLCDFIVHLIQQDFDQETYVLCASTTLTVEQTVHQLATCLNLRNPVINTTPAVKQQFIIDSSHAQRDGWTSMTLPAILRKFAKELLEVRNQPELDL